MAGFTFSLGEKQNAAGEVEIKMRIFISRKNRIRVPSSIWIPEKRWNAKKCEITVPNTPGTEREGLMTKRAQLKSIVDGLEPQIEAMEDKTQATREWAVKQIRKILHPNLEAPIFEKKITFFSLVEEYLATHKLSESRVKHFNVLVRTLKRYELYCKLSNKRFVLDVHTMTSATLDDIGTFMMSEPQIFDEHPELYVEVPYARSKVRKNLPVKRGPYTNEAGETVIPGRPR